MLTPERTTEIERAAGAYVQQLIASGHLVREDGKWWSSASYFAPDAKVSTDEEYRLYDRAYRNALDRASKSTPPPSDPVLRHAWNAVTGTCVNCGARESIVGRAPCPGRAPAAQEDPPPELTCPPDGCGAYECHENGCTRAGR